MGYLKQEELRRQSYVALAEDVARRAGALRPCPLHEHISLGGSDPDGDRRAYAMGTNMIKRGEVDASREEFLPAIKAAIDDGFPRCPVCERILQRQ